MNLPHTMYENKLQYFKSLTVLHINNGEKYKPIGFIENVTRVTSPFLNSIKKVSADVCKPILKDLVQTNSVPHISHNS